MKLAIMVKMKKKFLTLFAAAIVSANISAQESQAANVPKKSPEEKAEKMTARLTTELALTPAQQTKVKALILQHEQARAGEMKDNTAEREKFDADIKTILTPEQYQTLEQKREEMKQRHHQTN